MGPGVGKGPHFLVIGVERSVLDLQKLLDSDVEVWSKRGCDDAITPLSAGGNFEQPDLHHWAVSHRTKCGHDRLADQAMIDIEIAQPMGIDRRWTAALP